MSCPLNVARGAWPVVLADHSDRSGSATWVLQQVIEQELADALIATIADRAAAEAVVTKGLRAGDPFGGALPYREVDISKFYPYDDVRCPE